MDPRLIELPVFAMVSTVSSEKKKNESVGEDGTLSASRCDVMLTVHY
jgi:hypothetical protein